MSDRLWEEGGVVGGNMGKIKSDPYRISVNDCLCFGIDLVDQTACFHALIVRQRG